MTPKLGPEFSFFRGMKYIFFRRETLPLFVAPRSSRAISAIKQREKFFLPGVSVTRRENLFPHKVNLSRSPTKGDKILKEKCDFTYPKVMYRQCIGKVKLFFLIRDFPRRMKNRWKISLPHFSRSGINCDKRSLSSNFGIDRMI